MNQTREYQQRAVIEIRNSILAGERKPLLVLSTAAGKSHIFCDIIKRVVENKKRVLWIVHRRNLVLQFKETLKKYFDIDAGIIMSGIESKTNRQVQLCTVQTMARRVNLGPEETNRFIVDADIVMIDEAHHSISPSYQKILDYYEDKILIGCTATPLRLDNRPLNQVFTNIVEVISMKELTEQGYLSPLRYFVPSTIDVSGIKKTGGDYNLKELSKRSSKKKIIGDVVQTWLKSAEDRKTLIFAVDVKHSIYIRDEFIKAGIVCEHLDSRSDDTERQAVFDRMESGETKIITNVMLYNEGMDTPGIAACCIVRPTKSLGLWRQMIGRVTRILEGKEDAMVFDFGGNYDRHGPAEDELIWSLSGTEKAFTKPARKEAIAKPVTCRICHQIFIGVKVCNRCGTELKTFGKKVETVDAELKELKGKKKTNRDMSWEDKAKIMGAFVYYAQSKGYKPGWAAMKYKDYFSVFPNDPRVKNMGPLKPEGIAKNILTHMLIKSAKAYKKKQELENA